MATRVNTFRRIENRKTKADQRKQARDLLSPAQQIEKLDQLFGVGVGAKRERIRLRALVGGV